MVDQAGIQGLRVGRESSSIWITSDVKMVLLLDHVLQQREVMENNNREPCCNDKDESLPAVMIASIRAEWRFR